MVSSVTGGAVPPDGGQAADEAAAITKIFKDNAGLAMSIASAVKYELAKTPADMTPDGVKAITKELGLQLTKSNLTTESQASILMSAIQGLEMAKISPVQMRAACQGIASGIDAGLGVASSGAKQDLARSIEYSSSAGFSSQTKADFQTLCNILRS
jgi:hypothetical protein